MHQPTIVRCGISYDRQPYEPVKPCENVVPVTSAGIALIHGILTHYCGYGFYDVDEMMLPLTVAMVDSVTEQLQKYFLLDNKNCTLPVSIQRQTDAPRTCVSCNVVGEITSCSVFPYATSLTISEDTNYEGTHIELIKGVDSMTYLFPRIGDSIICVMSEENQPEVAPGGTWDDMPYDTLPPMSIDFFKVFIKYLVAIVCYGDKNYQARHLSSDFPKEYLHPVFN